MDFRRAESRLAKLTLVILVIYFPVETWTSWAGGLLHPMYLVDLVAMILLFTGARRSLRGAPKSAPGLLTAAWAWTAANGWRATSWRALEVLDGGTLTLGNAELWATGVGTFIALACFATSLWLTMRSET